MEKVILLRYGEIHLKGANRGYFEHVLLNNIRHSLKDFDCNIQKVAGRYEVNNYQQADEEEIIDRLTKVFGLHSLSVATKFATDLDAILDFCGKLKLTQKSFKVEVRRADKRFATKSMDMMKSS